MMKRLISTCLTIFCCVCLMLATERRAMAYVDPGSGLLALQSIGSMLAAAARERVTLWRGGTENRVRLIFAEK